jgi:quercetin dioxygenase-like cupin family protein
MALPHAAPAEVIEIHPLSAKLKSVVTTTLVKTAHLQVIRLVLPAGKDIPPHKVAGEITIQCLEGRIAFTALGRTQELGTGQLLFLSGGEEHAIKGIEDAAVLVTILLHQQ